MAHHTTPDDLSTPELQAILLERRRAAAHDRLSRLNGEDRVVDVPGAPPPPDPADWAAVVEQTTAHYGRQATRRRRLDRTLLAVELLALIGLVLVAGRLWQTNRDLNADLAAVQRAQVAQIAALQAQTQQTATAASAAAMAARPAATLLPGSAAAIVCSTVERWL